MRSWKPGPPQAERISLNACSAATWNFPSSRRTMQHERATLYTQASPPLPRKTDHRRGYRRVREEHATALAAQVAGVERSSSLLHGVELLGAGQRHDQTGKEKQKPDADDVQLVARNRLCQPAISRNFTPAQSRHDRLGRPLHVYRLRS